MAAESYDVVLTDIRMADLDGRALYHEIERRWRGRGARVVFVTGDTLTPRRAISSPVRPPRHREALPPSEVRRVVAELAHEIQRPVPDR
jgi:two-component system NtrC family sensor kinase